MKNVDATTNSATQNGSIVIIHCASNWLPNATEIIDKVITRLRAEKAIELEMVTELLARAESRLLIN